MIRKLLVTLLILPNIIAAQASEGNVEPVPLEAFAAAPSFNSMRISPDGKHYAATFPMGNQIRLAILDAETFQPVYQYFFGDNDQIAQFWWVNNNRLFMRTAVKSGQYAQRFLDPRVYAADIGGRVEMVYNHGANFSIEDMLPEDPEHIVIVSNHERRQYFNVYKMNVNSGRLQTLARNPFQYAQMLLDENNEPVFALENDVDSGETRVWTRSAGGEWDMLDSFPPFKGKSYTGSIRPVGISPDKTKVYLLSDQETDTMSLYTYDLSTKKRELVYEHKVVDVSPVYERLPGWENARLVGVAFDDGRSRRAFIDEDGPAASEFTALQGAFPNQYTRVISQTENAQKVVLEVSSDKNPGTFYEFDREARAVRFLAQRYQNIDPQKMASVHAIKMNARDGLELHGYITLPPGVESLENAKDLPMVVYVHGGPHGPRDYWTFDPYAQAIASRGYALLQINFRGSGGYGKEFEQIGFGKWGQEMQDDVTDATMWAVEQGYADKDRLCIFGGSYGGYAALMGVVKEPDLYQCAVGYVGVYDLPLMKNTGNVAERLDWGLDYLGEALGDDPKKLIEISPHYHVDKIKADVFIVHGGRDEQAHYDNALNIREEFKKHGKEITWMWKETEGHGFADPENRLDLMEAMVDFFDKNIGE